mgnify:CR=1 FL=1
MMKWFDKLRGHTFDYDIYALGSSMPDRDEKITPPDFYLNGLKARETKQVEIPIILSRKVKDPVTDKVIFDAYNGPLSTTFEFD